MRFKGKKILLWNTLIIYICASFLQYFSTLFEVRAAEKNIPRINVITVLIDDSIYSQIESEIKWYTTDYIQQEIPNSKALVLPINLKEIDAHQIYKMMENIYFDGLEGVNSELLGTILIGDIPLPVINQGGYIFPSIYPYVDFIDQKYIWDNSDRYFIPNENNNWQAEIRHGMINYQNDIQKYKDFFQKLKSYITNPKDFIGDYVRYEDFIASKNGFLEDNLQYYQNKTLFSEDIWYQRYHPLMLEIFKQNQDSEIKNIVGDLGESIKELGGEGLPTDFENISISDQEGMSTKTVERSIKEGFVVNYPSLFSPQNSVAMRDNVIAWGRWIKEYKDSSNQTNLEAKVDSSSNRINLKDTINMGNTNIQGVLINYNNLLEKAIDQKIQKEKYDMDIVIPVQYRKETSRKKLRKCIRMPNLYEVFYFGKSASLINDAKELSIYRGTFRNLENLENISFSSLKNSTNPTTSKEDTTKTTLKSIGGSYDIFSTQVEGNRGYNLMNTRTEYERYEENKIHAEFTRKCNSRFKILGIKIYCRQYENVGKGDCNPWDGNPNNDGRCETLSAFAERQRGGASPMNLNSEKLPDTYELTTFNGSNARKEIFDIGGAKKVRKAEKSAHSFLSAKEYSSPTAKIISEGKYIINQIYPTNHIEFSKLDYFKLSSTIVRSRKIKQSGNTFEIYNTDGGSCWTTKEKYSYKTISSIVKNVSTTDLELNGINTTKYWTGSPLNTYYKRINEGLLMLSGDIEEIGTGATQIKNNITTGIDLLKEIQNNLTDPDIVNNNITKVTDTVATIKTTIQELYENIDKINASYVLNIISDIEYLEYETLKTQKLDFPREWFTNINLIIQKLVTNYNTEIAKYKSIFTERAKLRTEWNKTKVALQDEEVRETINTNNVDLLENRIQTIFEIQYSSYQDEETNEIHPGGSFTITNAEFNDSTFNKELLEGFEDNDEESGTVFVPGVWKKITTIFQENNQDEPLEINWINLLTPDRPIDSPRYITFQSIAENEVNFIYPNLFKVEVYKIGSNGYTILKTKEEIKASIIEYLQNKVKEYNTYLTKEKQTAQTQNKLATSDHYKKLYTINPLATPSTSSSVRNYNLFSYDEVLAGLGGETQLDIIAELLYYQNLTNTEKQSKELIIDDINAIKDSFDINNKVQYILHEYLTQGKNKSPLVLPNYREKGYEVAYINSDGNDYIRNEKDPSFVTLALQQQETFNNNKAITEDNNVTESEIELQEKCGIPVEGSVLLFDISSMSSPWLKAFLCWVEETIKTPAKLSLDFSESLWPVIFDQDIWEYMTSNFNGRKDAMQDYGDQRKDLIKSSEDNDMSIQLSTTASQIENENKQLFEGTNGKRLSEYYAKIKTNLDTNTINKKTPNATLKLSATTNIGTIDINISGTGDSCLQINSTNLCNKQRTKRFNPYESIETLTVSPADKKAGSSMIIIEICPPNQTSCVKKTQKIEIKEGDLKEIIITPKEKISARGILTPINISAFDEHKNPITRSLSEYTISTDIGEFLHEGGYKKSFKTNNFKNLNIYYQAPLSGSETSATFKITTDNWETISTIKQSIITATPLISLNDTYIKNNSTQTIKLKNTDTNYTTDTNNLKQLNKASLQKIEVQLKDEKNQTIKLNTTVQVKSINNLIKVWEIAEKTITRSQKNLKQSFFRNKTNFEIENGILTLYLQIGTKAGDEQIRITIPGLETYNINIKIESAPANTVEIVLPQEQIRIGSTTTGEISIKDNRGNLVTSPTTIKSSITSNIITTLPTTINGGHQSFSIKGEKSGVWYIIADIISAENTNPAIAKMNIEDNLIPTSWLNILYLNYFGNDRGNQRWYFSDNNKYIEELMSQSNKIISTTTQLIQPSKIKRMLRGIAPNFEIKNYERLQTTINLQGNNIHIQAWELTNLSSNIWGITWITTQNEQTIKSTLNGDATKNSNLAFFLPTEENYAIINGKLYNNTEIISENITATLSDITINNQYQVWELNHNGQGYGYLVLHLPKLNIQPSDLQGIGSDYIIEQTFANGSSQQKNIIGIFDKNDNLELDSWYLSIEHSDDINNNIGFRGDFKNISLFAQGERVGNATKEFGSELLINLGDPLLKKYDKNLEVYNTVYDGGVGENIFSDPEKTIFKVKEIDFNNDGFKDILVVYTDGTLKLAKNYGEEPHYRNLENLMFITVGVEDVFVWDVDKNGYEDIIIKTINGQLRVYLNQNGVFDVDGNLACLNANVEEGEITKDPSNISDIYQIFFEDMNKDWAIDIITNDAKGYIKIFYWWKTNGYINYLSKEKYTCDSDRHKRQQENTKVVTRYGIRINESIKIIDNSMIHEYGLTKPEEVSFDENNLEDIGVNIPSSLLKNLENSNNINTEDLYDLLGMDNFDTDAMSDAGITAALKYQEIISKYEINKNKENIFIPISYLEDDDKITVYKTFKDINGGILEKDDIIEVTVHIQAKKRFSGAFGDKIQGPRNMILDKEGIPETIKGVSNKNLILHGPDENFSYLIDNIQLQAGWTLSYSYQLIYENIQTQEISIEDINGKDYKENSIQADGYPDIKLQPQDGCIKYLKTFINTSEEKHKSYKEQDINLQKLIDEYVDEIEEIQNENSENLQEQINNISQNENTNDIPGFENTNINLKELLKEGINGGINLDLDLFGDELDTVQQELDKLAEGLCNGFTFGGSNTCKGLPVPFNQAFLAPGDYHLFGCIKLPLVPLNKGLPVFHFPGTLVTPIGPIPIPRGLKWPWDGFIRAPGGTYPSMVRIYVSPTLTAQVGVAVCMGPYSVGTAIPSPFSELGGNCIVTVIQPQCKSKGENTDENNPNETYDPRIDELTQWNTCNQTAKGNAVAKEGYGTSPLEMVNSKGSFQINQSPNYAPYVSDIYGGFGLFQLERDVAWSFGSDNKITSSITIGGIKIEGWNLTKNRIKSGLQQGLRKILIDNRLDPQIKYIANNFTKMHIEIKWPNITETIEKEKNTLTDILKNINNKEKESNIIQKELEKLDEPKSKTDKFLEDHNLQAYKNLSTTIEDFNDKIANPFEELSILFNKSNLININTKNLNVKIPMIFSEDINAYEIYLNQRADTNRKIIDERKTLIESISTVCLNKDLLTNDKETIANSGTLQQKKQECSEEIQRKLQEMIKFTNDFDLILDRINSNILTLQEYRNFPFDLYERVHAIDRYVAEISAILNNFMGYLSYWMTTNANRFEGYVDAIILIMNIIKTYQVLIDFSVNRSSKCSTCTNDTYDQYSCKLSMLCDLIKLPIIQIPNFKIPDITIDFSNLNMSMDILLPIFNFQPEKIDLPSIPNLPTPPAFNIDINFLLGIDLSAPSIPDLPSPPKLPELPSFIPNINLELPILPPAPELPKIPNTFEATLKFAEKIGRIYCIVKQGIGLVGESSVKAKIEQLSQRTYEVPRIDNILDLTNLQAKTPKLQGFDYEIIANTNIQFSFAEIYNLLDVVTTSINNLSSKVSYTSSDRLKQQSESINTEKDKLQDSIDNVLWYKSDEIEYTDYTEAKSRLNQVLAYFNNQVDDKSIQNSIKNIQNTIHVPSEINANLDGIQQIKSQVDNIIKQEQSKYLAAENIIKDDYDQLLLALQNTKENNSVEEEMLAFDTTLFTLSKNTEEKISTLENPYKLLLDNKSPIINGFLDEIENNNPEVLNMTTNEYIYHKKQLTNLKNQIATFYQRIQGNQQTSLQNKNSSVTNKKTLTAATTSNSNSNSQTVQVDPSAYVQGIFTKTKDSQKLTKVVYSEIESEKIGTNYYHTDANKDGINDIILWDSHTIYIKYANQENKNINSKLYSNFYSQKIYKLENKETFLTFDKETILKIFDEHEEVKNFDVQGQNFDSISLSRRKWYEDDIEGYMIKLTERIDHSPEKQEKENISTTKYVLILPPDYPIENTKLELIGKTEEISKLLEREVIEIIYVDSSKENYKVAIEKIERKRQYVRIATLKKDSETLLISSPRSNQLVAGRQILGDNQWPEGNASLYRIQTKEEVSSWTNLEGYVGTYYNLIMEGIDNVALKKLEIEQNNTIIAEKETNQTKDTISLENLFFTGTQVQKYILHTTDRQGTSNSHEITLNIKVPEIAITNIEQLSETWASIHAEISQDIDEGTISFQKNRNWYRTTLFAEDQGKKIDYYDLKSKQNIIQGKYYSISKNIGIFSKSDELIAEIDPETGEIQIQKEFENKIQIKISFSNNTPVIQLYDKQSNTLVFNITLPTKSLINVIAPEYSITEINDENFWIFNGGKVIHKNGENILFISPKGQIYTTKNLLGEYKYNSENKSVSYNIKESNLSSNKIEIQVQIDAFKQ